MSSQQIIVDFPKLECESEPSSKRVRISARNELVSYEIARLKSDKNELFYNSQDYRAMRIENQQAVMDVQKKFLPLLPKSRSDNSSDDINTDAMFGNERFLTPKLVNKVLEAKKKHRYAVLQEQARQDKSGEKDPGAIARSSLQFSESAASRARAIGLLQSGQKKNRHIASEQDIAGCCEGAPPRRSLCSLSAC